MTVKDATRAFCWQHVSSWCHDLEITAADKRDPPWILFPPAATWSCLKTNYSPPCEFKTFSAKFQLPEHLKTKASLALACSCTCRHTCVTEDSVGEDLWEEVSPVEENGTELKWWHCQRSSIDSLGMMVHSGQILETKLCKTKKVNFFLFIFVVWVNIIWTLTCKLPQITIFMTIITILFHALYCLHTFIHLIMCLITFYIIFVIMFLVSNSFTVHALS